MTQHILSSQQIERLSGDEIQDLIRRLGAQRSAHSRADLQPLLAEALRDQDVAGAVRLELGTWAWDNGYFPYFGVARVALENGEHYGVYLDEDGSDRRLCELITAEARAFGLGEHSRIKVSVATGDVDVD